MEYKAPLSLDSVTKLAFCMEGRDKLTKVRLTRSYYRYAGNR